jgi:NAD(P)-dependent dehydrogenase (short-subunit alcohol dehydrogenase family)
MDNLPSDFLVTRSAYTPIVYRDQYPAIDPKNSALSQDGKVIIITGATNRIGAEGFTLAFAKANPAAIVLVGRNAADTNAIRERVREVSSRIDCISVATNIADLTSVTALFQTIKTRYGQADVLVNNAIVNQGQALLGETDAALWWSDFEINVKGTFLMTRAFLSALGTERRGTIINVASRVATKTYSTLSSYSMTNLSLMKIAEYVAEEYSNVTAVTLHPGYVCTSDMSGKCQHPLRIRDTCQRLH